MTKGTTSPRKEAHVNKTQQKSAKRLTWAIDTIRETAQVEMKRRSQDRKSAMESAYSTLRLHAGKLGLSTPDLSTGYDPEQYLNNAVDVMWQLHEYQQPPRVEPILKLTFTKGPGIYATDERDRHWSFSGTTNGAASLVCTSCGKSVDRGWRSGIWSETELFVCLDHIVYTK